MKPSAEKRRSFVITLLVVLIAAAVVLIEAAVVMYFTRHLLLLRWLVHKQDYGSFRLEHCGYSDKYKKITLEFEVEDDNNLLADTLALREDIQALLAEHGDLYSDCILECEFSTDSMPGYIRYANFDRLTGVRSDSYDALSFGNFHDVRGSKEPFRDASSFTYLFFLDTQIDDVSVLDSQTDLKHIEFHSSNLTTITEENLALFAQKHPDCEIG